jgi:hypothetical protein
VWKLAAELPDGDLRATALPSGAILVETPTGRSLAISGASSQVGLGLSLDDLLPLSHPRLDWLILVHPEATWEEAMETLGRHAPARIMLLPGVGLLPPGERTEIRRPQIHIADPGTQLNLGDGATLEIFAKRTGQWSALISMGNARILVSDPTAVASPAMALSPDAPTALILLGPGRKVGAGLKAVRNDAGAMLVVGCPTPGDPLPEDAIDGLASNSLATSRHGWVKIETDGARLRVEAERSP